MFFLYEMQVPLAWKRASSAGSFEVLLTCSLRDQNRKAVKNFNEHSMSKEHVISMHCDYVMSRT